MNIQTVSAVVGLVVGMLSIIATFVGVSAFYRQRLREVIDRNVTSANKQYAAERDFAHLQTNYTQLQQSLDILNRDLDTRIERIEIRFARMEVLVRMISKSTSGETTDKMISGEDL